MKLPGFVKMPLFTALLAGTAMGVTYVVNHAYNDDQVYHPSKGIIQYTKVDGIYAHTILTKGDPRYGKNSAVLEKNTLQESRMYIGKNGCSSIDTIIIKPGPLGDQPRLEYKRGENNGLKDAFFKNADAEMLEQCKYFMTKKKMGG